MDLSIITAETIFGFSPRKAVRFFLARMWIGYALDAGGFAFIGIYNDIDIDRSWVTTTLKWAFYGYAGGIILIAILITFLMIACILSGKETDGRLKRHKKIPYFMAYFKLTSAVNAGIVFYTLYFKADDRSHPAVLAILILSGIDMGMDLLEMAFGCAGIGTQRLRTKKKVHDVDEIPVVSPLPVKKPVSTRKSRK